MKINQGYQDSRAASAQDAAKTQETAAAAQARAAKAGGADVGQSGSGDEVNLSSLASALQDALTDSPERSAYIEQLSAEFAAGTYKPEPAATAGGIVNDSLLDSPPDSKK